MPDTNGDGFDHDDAGGFDDVSLQILRYCKVASHGSKDTLYTYCVYMTNFYSIGSRRYDHK